ncbi:MupA/Atu3671 family FMN-dependent luciferase-like monooxygenase [Novosphingobium sp. BL-52-GroH]|uniref:MupA/Atu3671 family FMN-dependent luciferase-like monooxygenase n=1 Tax=Novosphingobium sp. BL-52-GroH TaxID=3349877 RepID=UPI00384C2FD5
MTSFAPSPLRCVLVGSERLLIECAAKLQDRGHQILAIITDQAPILDWARGEQIPVLDRPGALPAAGLPPFDYLFSITNLRRLSSEVIEMPTRAAINFHDGLLPDYAGLNTPVWALMNGEARHGISWHLMTADIDAGDLLLTRSFDLDADDSALSVNTKCFVAAIDSFDALVAGLESDTLAPRGQGDATGRLYGLAARPAAAGTIDWSTDARDIARLVRALDHGTYANPLGAAKTSLNGKVMLVGTASVLSWRSEQAPGTIVAIDEDGLVVATASEDLRIGGLTTCGGTPIRAVPPGEHGLAPGVRLDSPSPRQCEDLSALNAAVGKFEPWWRRRLARRQPLQLPQVDRSGIDAAPRLAHVDLPIANPPTDRTVMAALVACLARVADKPSFDLGYADPILTSQYDGLAAWFSPQLPLGVTVDFTRGLTDLREGLCAEIRQIRRRIGHAADIFARSPELRTDNGDDPSTLPVAVVVVEDFDEAAPRPGADLTVALLADNSASRWFHDPRKLDAAAIGTMQAGFLTLLAAAQVSPDAPVGELPLLAPEDLRRVVEDWNATEVETRRELCIHDLFAEQVARTPESLAVTCRGKALTYAELDARSNQLAHQLRALGVGPDVLVGLHAGRSVDLLVALIAIHKAGGAYVPLDPTYPHDRIAYMIEDSRAAIIITDSALVPALPPTEATILCLDTDWPFISTRPTDPVAPLAGPQHLAYVIYTSGSTGKPKGVMVEHRNAVNFFAGMDLKIEAPGTWLAVTSLSFDISVLELCWTLTRGFHVVLATNDDIKAAPVAEAPEAPVEFSLFYFPSADAASAADQYRLLLEGARFADTHGFTAVWTPERHFHAFGGLYPNPSVAGAAIAAITSRVQIRGGSVVLPLHHPIRVAEEWSLVDNLSNGRVGISFAAGWQPNDFVLKPENFADRNGAMMRGIETVRALWRGEARPFPGPLGSDVETRIYPRPVQRELPTWITSAGNADTFAAAGTAGTFLLTHLLGQTVEELAVKIARYRAAWKAAGHAGEGHVTLMLHSFVGHDAKAIKEAVRAPMIAYLRTSTDLVKKFAWSFPAFKRRPGMEESSAHTDLSGITDDEMDALLEYAFDRYYETSGLFGTPQDCLEMVGRVRGAGVDEIGCLIDFGLPVQQVLDHLPALDALRQLANPPQVEAASLPVLMERHGVTHLQCTPSMAHMLVAEEAARTRLAGLTRLMIGGEAFPPALAHELHELAGDAVMNMYGPTETTIWSAVHKLDGAPGAVPLGRPLANQQVYILDGRQQPCPPGIPGELVIGGEGVVRGYLFRPELTAERFIAHPFRPGARAYRTGDLARQRADGTLEFLGRLDHQIKIRGYRIELGEIEAVLSSHPDVEQAIVSAREDTPGDVRLVGYYVPATVVTPPVDTLRDHMRAHLPEFMVPALLMEMRTLPRTPNGKVDRSALPAPQGDASSPGGDYVAPGDAMEEKVAGIWREVLKLDRVGTRDNFFDIGGHSLLAVQVHRALRAALDRPLPLTDIFRFPTVQTLSAHLSGSGDGDVATQQGQARAAGRRAALERRRGTRAPLATQ